MSISSQSTATPVINDNFYNYLQAKLNEAKERVYIASFIFDIRPFFDPYQQVHTIALTLLKLKLSGIDVRVMVEKGSKSQNVFLANHTTWLYLSYMGIPIRYFTGGLKLKSLHSKYVIIDNDISIIGSHNFTCDAFNHNIEFSVGFKDGKINNTLSKTYLASWEKGLELKKGNKALLSLGKQIFKDYDSLYNSINNFSFLEYPVGSPTLIRNNTYNNRILKLIDSATSHINIMMFLFLMKKNDTSYPTNPIIDSILEAHKRGVSIKIILDKDAEGELYNSRIINKPAFEFFQMAGIQVKYDSEKKLLHSKLITIDHKLTIIGSHNWTAGSFFHYDDTSVNIVSPEFTLCINNEFDDLWEKL